MSEKCKEVIMKQVDEVLGWIRAELEKEWNPGGYISDSSDLNQCYKIISALFRFKLMKLDDIYWTEKKKKQAEISGE